MALSSYTTISEAVIDWLNREGATSVEANTENFIELAQRRIQRDVRVPPMEVLSENISITDGSSAIPTAMLDIKEIIAYDGVSAWPVNRGTYAQVKNARLVGNNGPTYFDTVAGNIVFGPAPDGASVDLVYYQELEFISSGNEYNWFSRYAPELILFGALSEAATFIKDTEQEQKYEQKYQQALEMLKTQKSKAEYSGRLQVINN
jgi:hypothetical protein